MRLAVCAPIHIHNKHTWGGDDVTVTGHVRAGTGYRNKFQIENRGPLTNQAPFLCRGSSFSQMERTIIVKFLVVRSMASAVVTSVSGASGTDKSKFSKVSYVTPMSY